MHRVQKNILTTGSHDDSQHFTRVNFPAHILKNLPTIDLHTKITKTKKNWYILFQAPLILLVFYSFGNDRLINDKLLIKAGVKRD